MQTAPTRPRGNPFAEAAEDLGAVVRGLSVTFRYLISKPVTVQYPEERPVLPARHRGRHVLRRHENGLERCVGCELCALVCPSKAIFVEGAENSPDQPLSIGERYAKTYVVNMLRCVFCGFCVEACPTEAIQLKEIFELADYTRESMIYTKDTLLEETPTTDPNDSWLPG